jgi:2,5-furandicarboxylate decarboxylase 1
MFHATTTLDFDKYRLRNFVDRLIELGEVDIHNEPVPLTELSLIIEHTHKAVLFKNAGPEQVELVAKTAGSRKASLLHSRPARTSFTKNISNG